MMVLPSVIIISAFAPTVDALEYEWKKHRLELGARARLTYVDTTENAHAASLLTRIGLESEWNAQLTSLVELDHVALAWQDEFSNGEHFNENPLIPDVAGTEFNQVLLRYAPTNTLQFSLGREALKFGNERFVGTNSFWQNEQTFDGAGMHYEFGSASKVQYRYIENANRITGQNAGNNLSPSDTIFASNNGLRPSQFLGDHTHDTHVLFAEFNEWDFSRIHAYYFDIDIKNAKALTNKTLGFRYQHKGRWQKVRTLSHAELALQRRNNVNSDASLLFFDIGAGIGYRSSEISFAYQHLGENKGISFVTPLASLHSHNGWVDQFVSTPKLGLRDYKLQFIWRQNPVKIDLRYHIFRTDKNDVKIGHELDIDLVLKLNRDNSIILRYGNFIASHSTYTDEQRSFLMFRHRL